MQIPGLTSRSSTRLPAPLPSGAPRRCRAAGRHAARAVRARRRRGWSPSGAPMRGSRRRRLRRLHAAYALAGRARLAELAAARRARRPIPDLRDVFPAAGRMQRATDDLLGIVAQGGDDTRRWLRHGAWPADVFPLRRMPSPPRRPLPRGKRSTIRSSASRATACTRFRSARCTRAPSSPATSVSRSSARRCCGSSSAWATSTRASRSASTA